MPNCGHTQIYVSGPEATLRGLHAAARATRERNVPPQRVARAFSIDRLTDNARMHSYLCYASLGEVETKPGRMARMAMDAGLYHDIPAFDFVLDLSARYPDLTFDASFTPECDYRSFDTLRARAGEIEHNAIYRDGMEFRVRETTRCDYYRMVHLHERSKRGGSDETWLDEGLSVIAGMPQAAPGWHLRSYGPKSLLWKPGPLTGTAILIEDGNPVLYSDVDQYGGYGSSAATGFDDCVTLHPELRDLVAEIRGAFESGAEESVDASRVGQDETELDIAF